MMRETILEMFGPTKNALIEQFDECYTTITEAVTVATTTNVVVTRPHGGDSMQYREFYNTKPLEFDGTKGLISTMIWSYDNKGFFYISSCTEDMKALLTLNILNLGEKDWWKFVTTGYAPMERPQVS